MGVYLCSDYSLTYTLAGATRAQTPAVRNRTTAREAQLRALHEASKLQNAANIPLVTALPQETRAMLVCKVLVPRASKNSYITIDSVAKRVVTYNTTVAAQVFPCMLVHISVPKV